MIDQLLEIDREIFILLNGFHSSALDQTMYVFTNTWTWTPLYALFTFWIWRKYSNDSWIILIGIGLTILLADQITSSLMKPYFLRLRPTHEPLLMNMVHTVNEYKGGKYGFASSHAADTFGSALFLFLALRDTHRYMWLIFLWSGFVSYTRIYLGVHYPGDILAGALVGGLCGLVCYILSQKTLSWWKNKQALN